MGQAPEGSEAMTSGRAPEYPRPVPPREAAERFPKMPSGWLVELRLDVATGPYKTRKIALIAAARLSGPLSDKPLGSK